mmetsp:Transcript_26731/g.55012  ORF Transcript_26731/g.55012 Transcript_26731/m.55012 type:complete len:106 (-) Transcript_26731:150-467(-)
MCTSKTFTKRTNNVATHEAQENIALKESTLHSKPAHPQETPSTAIQDNFEAYSKKGVVCQEFEAFGITTRQRLATKNNRSNVRKSRVSTEIHPDLIMAELFLAEE